MLNDTQGTIQGRRLIDILDDPTVDGTRVVCFPVQVLRDLYNRQRGMLLDAQLELSPNGAPASADALDDICKLVDAPTWEYPGQVVRDVAMALGMSMERMVEKLNKAAQV